MKITNLNFIASIMSNSKQT